MQLSQAIAGFILFRSASSISQSTVDLDRWATSKLLAYLGDKDLAAVTRDDLRSFFAHLRTTPLKPASLDNVWKSMRAFFGWTAEELSITRPDKDLARPRYKPPEITPFTEQEIKALLKACQYTKQAESDRRKSWQQRRHTAARDTAIVLVLLDTGMRIGELARLTVGDLDIKAGELHIAPFGTGKKTKPRTVYAGKSSQRALWKYLTERGDSHPGDPLFLAETGNPLNRYSLNDLITRLGQRAGVSKCHPHKFRHTFAIQYLRNGGDVFTLQRILGHASLEMVRRYLALAQADDQAAHRSASPADRWRL